jgi:hypothetical protein
VNGKIVNDSLVRHAIPAPQFWHRRERKMNLFNVMSHYFWLVAIAVTVINAFIFRQKSKKYIRENPKLEEGYSTLFRGYLFWLNIPWVIMGIGCAVGDVPSVWHYFRPKDGNPYVLAWFVSIFVLWILGTLWLFFRGGAEILSTHPGALTMRYGLGKKEMTNPTSIKFVWLLALAAGIIGVAFMFFMDIPIPKVHK